MQIIELKNMCSQKIDKINFFGKIITCNNVTDVIIGTGVSIIFETNKNEIDILIKKINFL